jgi:hypothetical protein
MMVGMGRLRGRLAVAVWMATFAGCLGGESLGHHPLPSGSGGGGAASATGGAVGTGGVGSSGEPFCGTVGIVITGSARSSVLIVMERSSSMNDDSNEMVCTGGCGASSKWALASAAIGNLVRTRPSVNWGLALYGGDDSCDATGGATVDVGPGSAPAIEAALAATAPGGEAPTASAIQNAESYLQSLTDGGSRYILLVSDGLLGCAPSNGDSAGNAAAGAIVTALMDVGARTFVVGLAPDGDTTAVAALNQMAVNGEEGKPGTGALYYTLADLGPQFMPESSPPAGCALTLSPALAPVNTLAISATMADGEVVAIPQDPTTGWSFTDATESTIALNGPICDGQQNGAYTGFTIVYRCDALAIDTRRSPPADR